MKVRLSLSVLLGPTPLTVAVGLATVWLAFYLKLDQLDWNTSVEGVNTAVVSLLWVAGAGSLLFLVTRGIFAWPLALLLALWGWIYVRDVIEGRPTFSLLTGMALVLISAALAACSESDLSRWHLVFPVGFLAVSAVFAGVNPEVSFRTDWHSDYLGVLPFGQLMGIGGHPNHFGLGMAFGLLIILSQTRSSLWLSLFGLFFATALFLSGSDGAFVALVMATIVMFGFHDVTNRPTRGLPWRSVLAVSVTVIIAVSTFLLILRSGFDGFTSGRLTIWKSFLRPAAEAGWWGFSQYPDFTNRAVFDEVAAWYQDPHNTWLMTQLTAGHIGIILFALFWLAVGRAIWRAPSGSERTLALGLTVFLLSHGLVESQIIQDFRVVFPIYALLVALCQPRRARVQVN